jgi:hypothetical protein
LAFDVVVVEVDTVQSFYGKVLGFWGARVLRFGFEGSTVLGSNLGTLELWNPNLGTLEL